MKWLKFFLGAAAFLTVAFLAIEERKTEELHRVALKGDTAELVRLLKSGANIETRNRIDATPLHEAAWEGPLESAKLLLDYGADVNARGINSDYTPLHCTAIKGQPAIALLLLEHGATVNALSNRGETPVDFAIKNGHLDLANLLREHGGKTGVEVREGR
jgi:ankyrin repeat protein